MNSGSLLNNNSIFWFAFRGNELLVEIKDNKATIPNVEDLSSLNIIPIRTQDLGMKESKHYYSAELSSEALAPEGMEFLDLRQLFGLFDEEFFMFAGRAIQIMMWDKTHQFCGQCGESTHKLPNEFGKACSKCGLISYPRISPAIIVAITKGDKILLARNAKATFNRYSVLAGFVEPGETLEQCVAREVMEEVSIKIKNISYFGSQPWPFPNSLMLGFTAEYHSGEIKVDKNELSEAAWFGVDDMPEIPGSISIARKLIDWYVESNRKQ
jgi:NAD+ diphosphatase